jgi:AbrB family looped-hinge helix DNA binding protein
MPQLLQVSHVSRRGASLRITLPKGIREKLGLKEGDIVGFYEEDGKIILKKID